MSIINTFIPLKIRVVAYCLFVLLALLLVTDVRAQHENNLVFNSGFEIREPNMNGDTLCPGSGGDIALAKKWYSALGSVDYFNACSNEMYPNFGVPTNLCGIQNDASNGGAYAQIASFSDLWFNAREFLMQELPDTLKPGQGYFLSFKISLSDSANFATRNIGALFTEETTLGWEKIQFMGSKPQVESPEDSLLADKENWMIISGQFVAEGGERFISIGTFRSDSDMDIVRVSNHPETIYNWDASSYYIDDVELYEDNSIGIREPEEYAIELYPNPASELVNIKVNGGEQIGLHIKDHLGRALLSQKSLQKEQTINVAFLHAGVYFVEVVMKDGVVVRRRFIKE